ncbi:hypothetical protein ERO13_D13G084933v2 [Gossypium hirsutum]|uniref:Secreted protein n=1 Tax=Gossypium barbadense TaxID=3634 RepID=A0A5J5NJ65_GOSBA|nr:hypothetical protein ES319_D13G095300v1 [Gossypium barbadense]KAG4111059.1 hypothetical protein ERO13_D13G084933v2 [Gossypium hirsutum]
MSLIRICWILSEKLIAGTPLAVVLMMSPSKNSSSSSQTETEDPLPNSLYFHEATGAWGESTAMLLSVSETRSLKRTIFILRSTFEVIPPPSSNKFSNMDAREKNRTQSNF